MLRSPSFKFSCGVSNWAPGVGFQVERVQGHTAWAKCSHLSPASGGAHAFAHPGSSPRTPGSSPVGSRLLPREPSPPELGHPPPVPGVVLWVSLVQVVQGVPQLFLGPDASRVLEMFLDRPRGPQGRPLILKATPTAQIQSTCRPAVAEQQASGPG